MSRFVGLLLPLFLNLSVQALELNNGHQASRWTRCVMSLTAAGRAEIRAFDRARLMDQIERNIPHIHFITPVDLWIYPETQRSPGGRQAYEGFTKVRYEMEHKGSADLYSVFHSEYRWMYARVHIGEDKITISNWVPRPTWYPSFSRVGPNVLYNEDPYIEMRLKATRPTIDDYMKKVMDGSEQPYEGITALADGGRVFQYVEETFSFSRYLTEDGQLVPEFLEKLRADATAMARSMLY